MRFGPPSPLHSSMMLLGVGSSGGGSGVYGDQALYKTTIKAWPDDKRWLYCAAKPFTAANGQRLCIESGTGWTPGVYTNTNNVSAYATGYDGNQNMLYYVTSPAATPGLTDGNGYILGEFFRSQIICYGNSLTYGTGASAGEDYPKQLFDLYVNAGYPDRFARNYGTSGYTTQQLINDRATTIGLYSGSLYQRNLAIVWEGTNSLFFGENAATTFAQLQELCGYYKAAGYTVITATLLPRSDAGTPGTFETSRQTLNTSIRNQTLGVYWDAVYDVAGDSRLGDAGDELDTTYYNADKVHLIGAGYAIVAAGFKTILDTYF